MNFALPPPRNPRLNRNIGNLINNLLDCFVNYSLSVFEEIYPIIQKNDFMYLDNLGNFQHNIESVNNINTLLGWYILFYLDFRFILKTEDSEMRTREIDSLLEILKSQIYNFTDFNRNNMEELTESLNGFSKAKNEVRSLRIIFFIFKALLSTKLWPKKLLKEQIKLFFP